MLLGGFCYHHLAVSSLLLRLVIKLTAVTKLFPKFAINITLYRLALLGKLDFHRYISMEVFIVYFQSK